MTANYKILASITLVGLLATPLSGEVFAQPADSPETVQEISSELVEDESEDVEPEEKERWFKSEFISGNVKIGDFVVGPGRTEINLEPGETQIQNIMVTNRISDDRTFKLEMEDITGSPDGSKAVSLTGNARGPYSIRDYISYPENTFELALGERAIIPITITIPENAEPGGYYGSVLVSTLETDESTGAAVTRTPIISRIGSLFFITVGGDISREGKTLDVSLINNDSWWYESGPIELGILYENTGSVHVNPYGQISVSNMFGEEVGFVELEPWFVLPKSLRTREITWDREFLLGRYTVVAEINRGYEDIIDKFTVTFWVLPWKIVGGVFLVLFIVIFSIRAFFRTFEFRRKG